MRVGLQLMPGLPGESPAQALATLRRAIGLGPDFLRIYPTLVIAGTELERLYRAGDYVPMPLSGAISLCKIMLHEALKTSIPVIRVGLQASGELRVGDGVVAGPYHPAFRQLVEAELFYDLMAKLTADLPPETRVILSCSPGRVSDVAGQRRANVGRLRNTRGIEITEIKADLSLSPLELRMETDTLKRMGSMLYDLNYAGEDASYAC
jgi:hypothetical protein